MDERYKETLRYFIEALDHVLQRMQEWIDCQPTVDAEPVRHGEWIPDPESNPYDQYCASVCNLCGRSARVDGDEEVLPNYCDNCGAKMKRTEDQNETD